MPLIACPDCGTEVSSSARRCPTCGASAKAIAKVQPRKEIGKRGKLAVGIATVAVIAGAAISVSQHPDRGPSAADAAADAREQHRVEMTMAAAAAIKAAVRDPDSLVFEDILASDDGSAVIRYRARNGFGGMNREQAVFVGGPGMTSAWAWNRHCVHHALNDETDATLRMMKLLGQ